MVTLVVSCRYCGNQDAVRRKGLSTNGNQPHRRTGYKCENCKRSRVGGPIPTGVHS